MEHRKLITLLVITAILVLVGIVEANGGLRLLQNGIQRVFHPVAKTVYQWRVTVGNEVTSVCSAEDIARVEEALRHADAERYALRYIEEENRELREQLHFLGTQPSPYLGADVIGRTGEPVATTIIINRGSTDGIQVGQPVIVSEGILVGKIFRTYDHSAIVQLLTDHQSKVATTVLNRNRSIGIVEGGYDISMQMNFIPQNELVRGGDIVVTSGLEPAIPRGLTIGKVEAVTKEPYQPFQQAIITPHVPLNKLTSVSIILTASTPPSSTPE